MNAFIWMPDKSPDLVLNIEVVLFPPQVFLYYYITSSGNSYLFSVLRLKIPPQSLPAYSLCPHKNCQGHIVSVCEFVTKLLLSFQFSARLQVLFILPECLGM